jgi:regulator of protease activity HflC (stomatin/prohibitin superfamily)
MNVPVIVLVFALFIFFSSFFTVKQQTSVIIERFGKFLSVRNSGLQLKIPLIDRIAGRVNLKSNNSMLLLKPRPRIMFL